MYDYHYMQLALRLAARGLGNTWPSPAVGCVIVKDNQIIGRGWTQAGGHPHAESMALQQAGVAAQGATVYVTLEPCFQRRTNTTCLALLQAAGVARVVIACTDPDPRTQGQSITALKHSGIQTEVGLCAAEAQALNAGFFLRLQARRPFVTLKAGTSLDGKIALSNGESKWLTSEASRNYAQLLRAQHDGVLVGINTVVADDPQLTCRLAGLPKKPTVRIVLDSQLRLPIKSQLAQTAQKAPVWVITCQSLDNLQAKALQNLGVEIITVPAGADSKTDLTLAMAALAERGLTRVWVEGGGQVLSSFWQLDLWDELVLFQAPVLLGNDGRAAWQDFNLNSLSEAKHLQAVAQRKIGNDLFTRWQQA